MVLWFVGFALAVTWLVFHDPAIDYRMVTLGALVPNVLLLVPVVVLAGVMLATRGHRHARRRWLALPIGMFLHLVADGAWADAGTFWWPFSGGDLDWGFPAFDRAPAAVIVQELAGLGLIVWFVVRFRLTDPAVRGNFFRTGRLPRDRVA
ncbi:MAG: hypothetical protein ACRD12_12095 [Acidimicrobiales bacterium]